MIHLITDEANDIDRAQLVSQRFPELEPDTGPALAAFVVTMFLGMIFWGAVAALLVL